LFSRTVLHEVSRIGRNHCSVLDELYWTFRSHYVRSKRRVPFTQLQRLIQKDGIAQMLITNILIRRLYHLLSRYIDTSRTSSALEYYCLAGFDAV
jgi:hypothetical protein